jgi:hypothetical protein
MANIQEIIAADSYRPDPISGGGYTGAFQIDTRPIDALNHYTVMYNKAEYDQRAKDTQDKIRELADLTKYDPNSAIKKDRDYLIPRYEELLKAGEDYARKMPKNNQDRMQHFLEYQKKIDTYVKELNSGTARSIAYQKRKNDIDSDASLTPEQKTFLKQNLEDDANNTGILDNLPVEDKYTMTAPQITAGNIKALNVIQRDKNGNAIIDTQYKVFDPRTTMNKAFLEAAGLEKPIKEGTPEWEALTPDEKNYNKWLMVSPNNAHNIFTNSANILQDALNKKDDKGKLLYRKEDGSIDMDALKAANPIASKVVDLVNRWNDYATQKRNEIKKGAFIDSFGNQVELQQKINPDDYFNIDPTKPITPEQLVFLQKFAKADTDGSVAKYQYTGEALKRLQLDRTWALGNADLNLKRAKFNAQMKQAKTKEEQDKALDNYYYDNIRQQPTLLKGSNTGKFVMQIEHGNALPFLTLNGVTGKATALIPIGGKPIYDKLDKDKNPLPSSKIVGYSGGHYEPEFLINGEPVSNQRLVDIYNNYKANDKNWTGGLDKFLKSIAGQQIGTQKFDIRIRGANGTTTNEMNAAGMRIISNQNQKRGQASIWDDTDFESTGGGQESSYLYGQETQDNSEEDKNR